MLLYIVPNWRTGWKWFTVWIASLTGALQVAALAMPEEIKGWLPDWAQHATALTLLAGLVLARFVDQTPRHCDDKTPSAPR